MNTKQADQTYVAHTYARFPVEIVSGRGSEVFDETGKRYIDLTSGIGVDALGGPRRTGSMERRIPANPLRFP